MRLSRYFIKKWIDFTGYRPTQKEIEQLIKQSFKVQFYRVVPNNLCVPAIYWNVEHNLIFKVDEGKNKIITMYWGKRGTKC